MNGCAVNPAVPTFCPRFRPPRPGRRRTDRRTRPASWPRWRARASAEPPSRWRRRGPPGLPRCAAARALVTRGNVGSAAMQRTHRQLASHAPLSSRAVQGSCLLVLGQIRSSRALARGTLAASASQTKPGSATVRLLPPFRLSRPPPCRPPSTALRCSADPPPQEINVRDPQRRRFTPAQTNRARAATPDD